MKTTDLMVGDWVQINGIPHKIQAIDSLDEEISADNDLYYIGEDRCHSEDKIEGILITPEILEKNGFWVMENVANGAEEYIAYVTDGLIFHYNRDNDYYFPNIPISWKYIHQLQQVLRLCGFDELADNFKV